MSKDPLIFSHDIRNALVTALYQLEFGLDEGDEKMVRSAPTTIKQAIELSKSFSRSLGPKRDCGEVEMARIEVQEHFQTAVRPYYEDAAGRYDIEIEVEISVIDELKWFHVSVPDLISARENVISNAKNAGATHLWVHYQMLEDYGVVEIADNGCGMTREQIDRIYAKGCGDGVINGLGTQCILASMAKHGFFIYYDSEVGTGTTVRVVFSYD